MGRLIWPESEIILSSLFLRRRPERRRNLWTFSPGIMARTMKADSPSPRFHRVTPCSPGLITFGLKSLICCWKARRRKPPIPTSIKPFRGVPSQPCWKTFENDNSPWGEKNRRTSSFSIRRVSPSLKQSNSRLNSIFPDLFCFSLFRIHLDTRTNCLNQRPNRYYR